MVESPNTVCGLVGICAYTRTVSEGGTYRLVCIQLAFRMCIPWILKVGKVVVKFGLKQPFSAGLILQELAHLVL